jgi:hypothetical protein
MKTELLKKLGLLCTSPIESMSYIFTDSPTEDLDYERLLEGCSDCYRLPVLMSEPRKKKIIITNPFTNYDDGSTISYQLKLWSNLLEQGFEITAWTGELTPITSSLDLLAVLKRIQPVHHADLVKILAKNGVESDECYLAGLGHARMLARAIVSEEYETHYLDIENLLKKMPAEKLILICLHAYLITPWLV